MYYLYLRCCWCNDGNLLASGAPLWLVSQNKGKLLAFRPTQLPKPPPPRRKTERYWGSGYLSQSAH